MSDLFGVQKMNHQQALTRALVLCVTSPEHRLGDRLKLAHEIAERCTPAEVARAKENAREIME